MPLYLPCELTSVPIATGDANPFGIDPETTTPIVPGNVNPFGIDPETTVPIPTGNVDPWGIDPERTTVAIGIVMTGTGSFTLMGLL